MAQNNEQWAWLPAEQGYWNDHFLAEKASQVRLIGVAIRLMPVTGSTIHYYRVYARYDLVMPGGEIEVYRKVLDDHKEEYVARGCAKRWAENLGTRVSPV